MRWRWDGENEVRREFTDKKGRILTMGLLRLVIVPLWCQAAQASK